MSLTKLFQRYTFTDAHLNAVLQDYRRKTNEVIDYFLDTDFGSLALYDTDKSDVLNLKWNEDDSNPRDLNFKVNKANRTINMSGNLTVEGASLVNQDLTTDASWTSAGLSSTGEIDVTKATALLVDLNPGFTGTGNVIELTPSAAIATEDAAYCGFFIDGTSLTPTSAGVEIDGIFIDFSAITLAQTPVVHGLHVKMPGQETALHTDGEIHVDYATGSSAGAEYTAVDIILDVSSLDTNSEIHGLDVALAGSTSGSVAALGAHPGIDVIHQHVGTFGNIDTGYTLVGSSYTAEAFTSATAIVAANGDSILIGEDAVFDEIQVTMAVVATKTAFPKFYYSYDNAGTAAWTQFFPADDTEGFVYSGTIRMNSADLVAGGWEANDPDDGGGVTATKFYIKITRNRTASIGSPTAILKTLASTEYMWDKDGAITALSFSAGILTSTDYIALTSNNELRFYDNGNYVGFEAPALGADFIWKLPAADGLANDVLGTDSGGNLIWITGTALGNVVASGNFSTDNVILRSDGVGKGAQHTGIVIDDSDRIIGDVTIAKAAAKSILNIDTYDTTSTDYSQLLLKTSDSDTIGTLNETEDGDTLGKISFQGVDDASSWQAGASIRAEQDGAAGTGEVPTKLVFETFSATASNTDQLVLKKGGSISMSKNLDFTSATSTITGGAALWLAAGANGIRSQTIYDDTTANAATLYVTGAALYQIKRSTSAKKYKDKITDLELDSSFIHNLRPVSFDSRCKDDGDKRFIGLIADEIEQIYPEIINYNENNEAESYDNQMLITLLLAEIQNIRQELDELKK